MAQHVTVDLPAVLLVVGNGVGAWADDGHVAVQHVEELRQLIQRRPAQKAAQRSDPRVVARRLQHHIGVFLDAHAAKFPDHDRAAVQPVAALAEQHRAGRGELDGCRDGQQRHGDQQQNQARQHDVFGTFGQAPGTVHGRVENADAGQAIDAFTARMQQVEHEHIRNQIDRCGGVAQAGNQLAQLRFGAESEGDVHLIDPASAGIFDQLLQVTQYGRAALVCLQIHLLRMRVVKAEQDQAHPGRLGDGPGQPLADLPGADDGHPTRVEATPTQGVQGQTNQQPVAAQHGEGQREPAHLAVIGQLRLVEQQAVQRQQGDEGHRPVTEDLGQLAQDALAAP